MPLARQSLGKRDVSSEEGFQGRAVAHSSAEVGKPDGRMVILLCRTLGYTQESKSAAWSHDYLGQSEIFQIQFAVCFALVCNSELYSKKTYVSFSQPPCPLDAVIFVLGSLNKVLAGYGLWLPLKVTSSIVIMLCDNVTVSSLSEPES